MRVQVVNPGNGKGREMPRERLLTHGPEILTDAELVALIIGTGAAGKNVLDLARELLDEHGGLQKLLKVSMVQLQTTSGLGNAKVARLMATVEIGRRYLGPMPEKGPSLSNPIAVRKYLLQRLRDRTAEVFAVVFLDNRNRIILYEEMFYGTIDSASVYPREVVKKALSNEAAALILVHNHPSGIADPSAADKVITRRLIEALSLVNVRMLDHFVVGDGDIFSFAEEGLL